MSSYQIYEFDGVALPLYNAQASLDSGAVGSSLQIVAGGAYDWAGSTRRLPRTMQVSFSGEYAAEGPDSLIESPGNRLIESAGNYLVTESAQANLRGQVDDLKRRIGVRALLWRRRWDDSAVTQSKLCRLLDVRERGEVAQRTVRAPLDLILESLQTGWRSAAQSSVSLLSNALVSVAGNLPVRNAVLTVTPASTITQVAVAGTGIDWRWTGALAAGASLVVDAEVQTVRAAGADAYSGFALGAGHTTAGWLDLSPGNQSVSVSVVGAASAVSLAWYNVFA